MEALLTSVLASEVAFNSDPRNFNRELFSKEELSESEQLEFKTQMQNNFFNISRLFDCIACDRCRLNGKV